MINNDRSLPMVIERRYSIEEQKQIVERCISDPYFFFTTALRYSQRERTWSSPTMEKFWFRAIRGPV